MYASLEDVKGYLGIDALATEADEQLNRLLLAADAVIDRHTGRSFAIATDTTRYFEACAVSGQMLMLDAELAQVTSVTNGDGTAIDVATLRTMPRNRGPYFALVVPSSLRWSIDDLDAEIAVTGRWGYSVTSPEDIRQAAIRLTTHWYRLKDAQVFDVVETAEGGSLIVPKGIPADVKQVLALYKRVTL
jgi:hypothetical protein